MKVLLTLLLITLSSNNLLAAAIVVRDASNKAAEAIQQQHLKYIKKLQKHTAKTDSPLFRDLNITKDSGGKLTITQNGQALPFTPPSIPLGAYRTTAGKFTIETGSMTKGGMKLIDAETTHTLFKLQLSLNQVQFLKKYNDPNIQKIADTIRGVIERDFGRIRVSHSSFAPVYGQNKVKLPSPPKHPIFGINRFATIEFVDSFKGY